MKLVSVADNNAIEIGCQVDSPLEIVELRRFVKQHLLPPKTEVSAEDRHPATAECNQVLAAYLETQVDDPLGDSKSTIWTLRNSFTVAL